MMPTTFFLAISYLLYSCNTSAAFVLVATTNTCHPRKYDQREKSIRILRLSSSQDDDPGIISSPSSAVTVQTASFSLTKQQVKPKSKLSTLKNKWLRKDDTATTYNVTYHFDYRYNELIVPSPANHPPSLNAPPPTTTTTVAIVLIAPIGVGIGRWYYDRFFRSLPNAIPDRFRSSTQQHHRLSFLAPDLLMCGSASSPTTSLPSDDNDYPPEPSSFPLLTVQDWSDQLLSFLYQYQTKHPSTDDNIRWCLVANGGCVPIALEIAARCRSTRQHQHPSETSPTISAIIFTAPPRASNLLSPPPPSPKLHRSYDRLCGIAGRLFWRYALRNDGSFIRNFSVKNLLASKETMGMEWTPNCVRTAKESEGRSRYSTFAFLAGSLKGGNESRLRCCLKGGEDDVDVVMGVIVGGDGRKNPARSWFWERNKDKTETSVSETTASDTANSKQKSSSSSSSSSTTTLVIPENDEYTLLELLRQNGNNCREIIVGGRRCPAHEDPDGFAVALMDLLQDVI